MDKKYIYSIFLSCMMILLSTISLAADVTLAWDARSGELQGYRIYYGTSKGLYTNNVDVGNVTEYTLSGLQADEIYYFVTRAYNDEGESGNSNEVTWKSEPADTPPAPGDTVSVEFGNGTNSNYPNSIEDTFLGGGVNHSTLSDRLEIYTWPTNSNANSILMKWNISNLPDNAVIQNASVFLYLSDMEGSGGDDLYEISVHKIVNHDPDISQCTWDTCDGVNSWTGGSNGGQQDVAIAEDIKMVDKSVGYKQWDVIQMVKDWVADPASNYGMMLLSDHGSNKASADTNRIFVPTENADASKRPKLVITYSVSGADTSSIAAPKGIRIIRVQ